ncbi:glycosyltransferase family 4 protein [Psychrobium sp. 1_MG-2023]|uniref:glycosyltransferase family 4 protein n=1 Tax=Psychrobium sp. 1_MG-2023 TaxID=3062624 RepID=UPI000C33C5EA|nr:glycosyltransferase family 4 protein [Psychrobium sp. 1_MG-2023]MDP2561429.1 glycosyltransferase family 4 protein [Psychrobium sp. 1_MG-2023]PKF57696.1 hypothetical protein CW748_05750 [Alteromonadales bacterium alter-6D02]
MEKTTKKKNKPVQQTVFFITPHIPLASGRGSEQRAWQHLQSLQTLSSNIHLIILDWGQRLEKDKVANIPTSLATTHILKCQASLSSTSSLPGAQLIGRLWQQLFHANKPFIQLTGHSHLAFIALINEQAPQQVFSFKFQSGLLWQQYRTNNSQPFHTVDFDDIESIVMARQQKLNRKQLGIEANLIAKLAIRQQREFENTLLKQADLVLVCSELDQQKLKQRQPYAQVDYIPNAVAITDKNKKPTQNTNATTETMQHILFVGTMSFQPNQLAIIYFCQHVLPFIEQQYDGSFTVDIVGYSPPPEVQQLDKLANVSVKGGVDSVSDYYHQASLAICPIQFGGGTRIKILEAMSFACPVVSTTIGAEGIDVNHNHDIVIADTPQQFAAGCISLMKDHKLNSHIGQQGLALVSRDYSDRSVQKKLSKLLAP